MDHAVVFEGDTEFNHYEVVDTLYGGRPARVLYSGNRAAAQSGIAQDSRSELLFDYNERFMELVRKLRPTSLLLIGGGAFTLPIALQKEFPNLKLDVVELDGELVDIAQAYFGFTPAKHTRVHISDARSFIDQVDQKYDLIIMDVFFHASIPEQLKTSEAAHSFSRCLHESGVLAVNVISALEGLRSEAIRRLHVALGSAFEEVSIFPAGYDKSPWIAQNFVMIAQHISRNLSPYLRYPAVLLPALKYPGAI